jgi:hypothetical protein
MTGNRTAASLPANCAKTAKVAGATLIAARMIGRVCFALELEPAYVDVAVRGGLR